MQYQTVSTALPPDCSGGTSSCGGCCGATECASAGAMSTACETFALSDGKGKACVSSLLALRRACKTEQRTCAAPAASRALEGTRVAQQHQPESAAAQRASWLERKTAA